MKLLSYTCFSLIAAALAISCAPKETSFEVKTPTANFDKYIAVGNSLTAGYADNGLYLEGQRVAFPNLIAQQMQKVGGGAFFSPFFSEEQANGSGYISLEGIESGRPVTIPVTERLAVRGTNPLGNPLYTTYSGEINNFGVPGMRLDLSFDPRFGSELGNPFFERLLSEGERGTVSYMDFASREEHTFFTFWLGNNDVLGYATNGAVTDNVTNVLMDLETFRQRYGVFIEALTESGQKGAVATIPDVTSVPFFTTVTYRQLLAGVRAVNDQIESIFIQTKQGPRPATDEDLFFLTFPTAQLGQGAVPFGLHPSNPISDHLVLDRDEVHQVKAQIDGFNKTIREIAAAKGLALVDVHAFLDQVRKGYVYNGIPISSAYISGNAFSLDGVHLTPMGNAIVANLFIEQINSTYNASIPKVDVSLYPGVKMPR